MRDAQLCWQAAVFVYGLFWVLHLNTISVYPYVLCVPTNARLQRSNACENHVERSLIIHLLDEKYQNKILFLYILLYNLYMYIPVL